MFPNFKCLLLSGIRQLLEVGLQRQQGSFWILPAVLRREECRNGLRPQSWLSGGTVPLVAGLPESQVPYRRGQELRNEEAGDVLLHVRDVFSTEESF